VALIAGKRDLGKVGRRKGGKREIGKCRNYEFNLRNTGSIAKQVIQGMHWVWVSRAFTIH